jgi:hypothetical protein
MEKPEISSAVLYGIVVVSPLVGGDMSIVGEITPMILAGASIALLPNSKGTSNLFAFAECILIYILYIQLSLFFSTGEGVALLYSNWPDIAGPKKIILGIVSNIRIMAVLIAASILWPIRRTARPAGTRP